MVIIMSVEDGQMSVGGKGSMPRDIMSSEPSHWIVFSRAAADYITT